MNNKKKCLFLIFLILFSNNIYPLDTGFQLQSNNERLRFIKKNIEINKKYIVSKDVKVFKKIIIGEWAAFPHSRINFKENGQFVLIYQMKYKREGVWDVGNNCILLKFNNEKHYRCHEIEYYILLFDPTIEDGFKYSLNIIFKEYYYWGSGLTLEFD